MSDFINRLKRWKELLQTRWWGAIVVYASILVTIYLAIWAVVEPLSLSDIIYFNDGSIARSIIHVLTSILVASHVTLFLAIWVLFHEITKQREIPEGMKKYALVHYIEVNVASAIRYTLTEANIQSEFRTMLGIEPKAKFNLPKVHNISRAGDPLAHDFGFNLYAETETDKWLIIVEMINYENKDTQVLALVNTLQSRMSKSKFLEPVNHLLWIITINPTSYETRMTIRRLLQNQLNNVDVFVSSQSDIQYMDYISSSGV